MYVAVSIRSIPAWSKPVRLSNFTLKYWAWRNIVEFNSLFAIERRKIAIAPREVTQYMRTTNMVTDAVLPSVTPEDRYGPVAPRPHRYATRFEFTEEKGG